MGSGIVSEHAITRSVRDSALLLDVTARLGAGEPYCAPEPQRCMMPPQKLGYLQASKDTVYDAARRMSNYILFCFIANGAGLPSASLPLHWNKEGLPIGVLTTAKAGCEDLLFSLAAQAERARPWAGRTPLICLRYVLTRLQP